MKTIGQFKEEYIANLDKTGDLTKIDIIEQNMNAVDAGVQFAQRWIPVEEESPAEYDYVLAKSSIGDVYVASFSAYTFHTGMPHRVNITHWRPIEYK